MRSQRDTVQVAMATAAKSWPDLRNVETDRLIGRAESCTAAGLYLAARVMRNEIEKRNDALIEKAVNMAHAAAKARLQR